MTTDIDLGTHVRLGQTVWVRYGDRLEGQGFGLFAGNYDRACVREISQTMVWVCCEGRGYDAAIDRFTWGQSDGCVSVVYVGGGVNPNWTNAKQLSKVREEIEVSPWGNPLPKGETALIILERMLRAEPVTLLWAITELALETLPARIAELRRLGWPIRSIEYVHPTLHDKTLTEYVLDKHFRRWYGDNFGTHPAEYPGMEGRLNPYNQRKNGNG